MRATRASFRPADLLRNGIFLGFHVATLIMVAIAGLPGWGAIGLCLGFYFLRMFAITGGYHRYFSHKTYKTSRFVQMLLAALGLTALQKGALWWAAHHRWHHRYSDTDRDVHSPKEGLFHAHVGWILKPESTETRWDLIKDLARYPELRFLNSQAVMVAQFALICAAVYFTLGFEALTYGCFLSTVLLWHGTFTINSLSHVWGKRVYATTDTSRNNPWLALITMGEGWHNNHHYYQTSCSQGFRWYEFDMSYRIIWALEKLRLVWDVRHAPASVVAGRMAGRNWLIGATDEAQETEAAQPAAETAAPVASAPAPSEPALAA